MCYAVHGTPVNICKLTSIAKCFERVEIVSATSALTATLVKKAELRNLLHMLLTSHKVRLLQSACVRVLDDKLRFVSSCNMEKTNNNVACCYFVFFAQKTNRKNKRCFDFFSEQKQVCFFVFCYFVFVLELPIWTKNYQ